MVMDCIHAVGHFDPSPSDLQLILDRISFSCTLRCRHDNLYKAYQA